MAFELVIVICVGLAAAGILMAITRPFGLKLGKTVAPVVAALAMLSYQVWSRYTWSDRISARLPQGSVVLAKFSKTNLYEPWSFVFPLTGSLLALDQKAILTHPQHPELRAVKTTLYEQGVDTLEIVQFLDCEKGRRALAAEAGPDGMPPEDAWVSGGEPAYLFAEACKP